MKVPTDRVVRVYEVSLYADDDPDPYDPFTITLSWPVATTPDDPYGDQVYEEALKRARKEEIKNGHMDEDSDTVLSIATLKLKGSGFIPAHKTFESGNVPRPAKPKRPVETSNPDVEEFNLREVCGS